MKATWMTLVLGSSVFLAVAVGASQDPTPNPAPAPNPARLEVSVPVFNNTNCPIMGKPVSVKQFVDTEKGRIYMCCKGCNKKILADVAAAHQAAYPTVKVLENKTCPVTGKPIAADSPRITLQGFELAVADATTADLAIEDSQNVLIKAQNEKVVDVANKICPVTGKPITKNTACLIGNHLVRLSSTDCVETIQKDPASALKKALESVKG